MWQRNQILSTESSVQTEQIKQLHKSYIKFGIAIFLCQAIHKAIQTKACTNVQIMFSDREVPQATNPASAAQKLEAAHRHYSPFMLFF